jgi:signal transduction histidine kinase
VLLARLRVRGKLAVLVATPLVLVMVLAAVVSADRFSRAGAAGATVRSVDVASHVGGIVSDLQQERLISVGYLLGVATASDVALASATVADEIVDAKEDFEGDLRPQTAEALNAVAGLDDVRQLVAAHNITAETVIDRYSDAVTAILSSMQLADGVDASTQAGREVIALDALLRIDELNNRSAAQLVAAAGTKSSATIIAYAGSRAAVDGIVSQFATYATNDEVALYALVGKAFNDRIGPGFAASFASSPNSAIARQSPSVVYPELTSFAVLGRFVETKIAADVTSAVTSRENTDLFTAYGTAGLALLIVLGIALLSIAVARSVAEPLTQLTITADRVARLAEAELERVADDEADSADPVRLEIVQVDAQDEVGDLARAFERVQGTAARLVERQVQSRRNVAEMLGHIGRRTQNLVGRQIAVIDALEAEETDADRLSELYRLDHIASRLRRNAGSLVVLSGAAESGGHFAPLPLGDVARLALAEIEAYTRVDVSVPDSMLISPAVINDLVLMLAELMENATTFSPPNTRVTVTATEKDRRLVIVDHGIGLSGQRLAEENRRIAQRERLDLAPSEVLGLFVVSRLARRHRIEVLLAETPGGGVTVRIDLSGHLLDNPTEVVAVGVPTVRGSAVVSGALTDDTVDRPLRLSTLDRAIRMLEAARPWNAFELPQPALPAGPSALADLTVTTETPYAPYVPYASSPSASIGASPAAGDPTASVVDPAEELAAEARAILDALAAADARAAETLATSALSEETDILPEVSEPDPYWGTPDPHNGQNAAPDFGVYPSAPVSPAPSDGAAAGSWLNSELPIRPTTPAAPVSESYDLPGYVAPEGNRDEPFAHRFQSNGLPLARRVPGATTRNEHAIPAPRQARPELDPSEARQLVEQFEFGVARAMREVEPESRGTEES